MQFIQYYLASTVLGPHWDGPSFAIILSMLIKACSCCYNQYIYLYNTTPSRAIVNAASNIT